jgi:triacylglycerol lipase
LRDIIDALVKLVGKPLYDEAGDKTSLFDALEQMGGPEIEKFNETITDQPDVWYASVTGRTRKRSGEHFCNRDSAPPFIAKWHDDRDPVDPFLSLTSRVLEGPGEPPRTNDGMVRVEDAKWGQFLGCIPADHLDEVGHLVGDEPGGENDFDHIEFFSDLVDYMQRRGF